jgi:hypothetical protein
MSEHATEHSTATEITDKLVYVSNTGQVSPWITTNWQTEDN